MPLYLKHAYGYVKASPRDNIEPIPDQIARIEAYYENHLKKVVPWGSIIRDDSIRSERGFPLFDRASGKKTVALLRPGDHLVFSHLETFWHSYEDFRKLLVYFRNQQIGLHILDIGGETLDTTSKVGQTVSKLLTGIQATHHVLRERRRADAMHVRRVKKQWAPGTAMFGCRIKTMNGVKRLVWNRRHRKIMSEVVRLRDEERMTWDSIAITLHLRVREGEGVRVSFTRMLYRREKMFRRLRIKDPMDLPRDGTGSLGKLEAEFGHEPPQPKPVKPVKPKRPSAWPPPDWDFQGRCKKRDRPKKNQQATTNRPESDL